MKKTVLLFLMGFVFLSNSFGQVNTFSQCYFTSNEQDNTDINEILLDAHIDTDGDYLVFGKQLNESLFPIANNAEILHRNVLDPIGLSLANLEFTSFFVDQGVIIEDLNHLQLETPICNEFDWIFVNETLNGETDVVAYGLDNPGNTITNTIQVTQLFDNESYFCYDLLQNNNTDIIWVGSRDNGNNEQIIACTFENGCNPGIQKTYFVFDPFEGNLLDAKAHSIVELNEPTDEAVYAVTGEAGVYAFCLLLDINLDPVGGQIYLYKINPSFNYADSGVKIDQIGNGNLVILGNSKGQPGTMLSEDFFFMELDFPSLATVWTSIYQFENCIEARDFEINSDGDYVVVGYTYYVCGGMQPNPALDPGWAFMTELDQNQGTVNWMYIHDQTNFDPESPFGTAFYEVEVIETEEQQDEIVAVGSCWERVFNPDIETGFETNNNYFAVKTDRDGRLLQNPECAFQVELPNEYPEVPELPVEPPVKEIFQEWNQPEWVEESLEIISEFCDQTTDDKCPPGSFIGPELVFNGGFSLGYTGFATAFNNTACTGQSQSFVHDNITVNACNGNWCATGTTGDFSPISLDKFLTGDAFNGAVTDRDLLWGQSIGVNPFSNYAFCANFKNLLFNFPFGVDPVIDIEINGSLIISNYAVAQSNCQTSNPWASVWDQISFLWNSGSNSIATLSIYLHRSPSLGADLAVDDISFRECSTSPIDGLSADEGAIEDALEIDSDFNTELNDGNSDEIKLYPNPTNTVVQVEFENAQDRIIYILNITGQQIGRVPTSAKRQSINMSFFENGLYLLMIEEKASGKKTTKMITKVN